MNIPLFLPEISGHTYASSDEKYGNMIGAACVVGIFNNTAILNGYDL
jgi:hypothetical protein